MEGGEGIVEGLTMLPEAMSNEQLLHELERTPELKRRLAVRIAQDILESEAFWRRIRGRRSRRN